MQYKILIIGAFVLSAIYLYFPPTATDGFGRIAIGYASHNCKEGFVCVGFLDVGQGDATFIESTNGTQVLIDGGPDTSVLRELGTRMSFFDRDIDMVVVTHPDQDHIGGLISVLERYTIDTIVMTENIGDTPVAALLLELIEKEGSKIVYARSGQIFTIDGADMEVLFPDRNPADFESNTASVILKFTYGASEFLFTGDSPQAIEKYLVTSYGPKLQSDVLKVGHHGSKTSSAESFVKMVHPEYAVISAGVDNRYGHPHAEVLSTLNGQEAIVLNTAENGTISLISNGIDIWIE